MCDQTEIPYLDGDVVWVKLGACWWPGQVIDLKNLPEDVQKEFQNKPLIAAVKFFQEDTYEFVKSYHQIYKYKCTQKDDFIKKGLDKYRNSIKDGSTYMDKFPGDIETAEKLTGGDPDILSSDKFSPEEKPDISSLFGEKKSPKKKRDRDEMNKKSFGGETGRKITHPRFLRESDHEVRIRQQPCSMSSMPNSSLNKPYSCQQCDFTTSRVNVIIFHIRSHSFNKPTSTSKSETKSYSQSKSRLSNTDAPKRKYVRKDKSQSNKSKGESSSEPTKRKQSKQSDKANKKKKTDPELREKLLADWADESDEDIPLDFNKITEANIENSASFSSEINTSFEEDKQGQDISIKEFTEESKSFLEETEKLLRDTEQLSKMVSSKNNLSTSPTKSNFKVSNITNDNETDNTMSITSPAKQTSSVSAEDDKKSRLSCFDFDEEDPEPTIPHVRKIPRLGGKLSLKKEIIKEFEMNEALKNEKEKLFQEDKSTRSPGKNFKDTFQEKLKKFRFRPRQDNETTESKNLDVEMVDKFAESVKEVPKETFQEKVKKFSFRSRKDNESSDLNNVDVEMTEPIKKLQKEVSPTSKQELQKVNANETEVEIVEILEFEPEDDNVNFRKDTEQETQPVTTNEKNKDAEEFPSEKKKNDDSENISKEEKFFESDNKKVETVENDKSIDIEKEVNKIVDVTLSEKHEEENIASKKDEAKTEQLVKTETKKRRGRPKKSLPVVTIPVDNGESNKSIEAERKISESDSERSFSGRRRKPNKKYIHSDNYMSSPEHRTFRTDESQSDEDMFLEQSKVKSRRGKKSASPNKKCLENLQSNEDNTTVENKSLNDVIDKLDSTLDAEIDNQKSVMDKSSDKNLEEETLQVVENVSEQMSMEKIEFNIPIQEKNENKMETSLLKNPEFKESLNVEKEILPKSDILENLSQVQTSTFQMETEPLEVSKSQSEILPPKKSQIKKFEQSQLDILENSAVLQASIVDEEKNKKTLQKMEVEVSETELVATLMENVPRIETTGDEISKILEQEIVTKETLNNDIHKESDSTKLETLIEKNFPKTEIENKDEKSETEPKLNSVDKKIEEADQTSPMKTHYKGKFSPNADFKSKNETLLEEKHINTFQEAFLKTLQIDNNESKTKTEETETMSSPGKKFKKALIKQIQETDNTSVYTETVVKTPNEKMPENPDVSSLINVTEVSQDNEEIVEKSAETTDKLDNFSTIDNTSTNSLNIDLQKVDKTISSTPSPSSDVGIPVKKREKPRIIENVALKEPMILKSKLLEKLPIKGLKHKLEMEQGKRDNTKGKMMRLESSSTNSKSRSPTKNPTQHLTMSQKLHILKVSEAEMQKEKTQTAQLITNISTPSITEKCIQQSSQSLEDMDLDINSMPFVLSEDVLTPDNIEQIPVVISTIPLQSTTMSTMSTTTTTQTQQKMMNEGTISSAAATPSKKKSDTPTILKSKGKAKPTITSIKTIVPPLTGGVKGLKFQNTQAAKTTTTLVNQATTPGKYVIVQTANNQQIRYSVQGKMSTSKLPVSSSKSSSSAPQIVQQGGKVVIITSPQSGQTKIMPLNVSKAVGGKLQRIVANKGQVYTTPLSPQGIINQKTMIASKNDISSPTTSKITQNQKILIHPGKSGLLGTVQPQGIIKSGMYTPITAATVTGKQQAVISPKKKSGGTLYSQQNVGTSKGTIVSPITQTISTKFLTTHVTSKGTVLTPITGQQVKAIAAKNPMKTSKMQYQKIQQISMPQKSQKTPSHTKVSSSMKPGTTVLYQNPTATSKKVKQQNIPMPMLTALNNSQSTSGASSPIQQKGNTTVLSPQKMILPRSRQSKAQQKIVPTKETMVQNIQGKLSGACLDLGNVPSLLPKVTQQKQQAAGSKSCTRSSPTKSTEHKNLLNTALNSVLTSSSNMNATLSSTVSTTEIDNQKVKLETDETTVEKSVMEESKVLQQTEQDLKVEKTEEPKITTHTQLVAVPTENSDGSTTYVIMAVDEHGQYQNLDNNTLLWEGIAQNPDGSRTLYIDPGDSMSLDNLVLQIPPDNGVLSTLQNSNVSEPTQTTVSESYPSSEIVQTSNQDILAAALANTDFQQEIGLPETPAASVMSTGLTQTSLINQTILQSTIIPPTEPISSPSVLETSLTLNQPIMTPLEVPSSLPIQSATTTSVSAVSAIPPSSLELPITITNPNISYITAGETQVQISGNSMPDIGEITETSNNTAVITGENSQIEMPESTQYIVIPNLEENMNLEQTQCDTKTIPAVSYSVSIPDSIMVQKTQVQTTPSMPIIDDTYTEDIRFNETVETATSSEQNFTDVPVSEMLVSKATIVNESSSVQSTATPIESVSAAMKESAMAESDTQDGAITSLEVLHVTTKKEAEPSHVQEEVITPQEEQTTEVQENHDKNTSTASMLTLEESCISSDLNTEVQSTDQVSYEILDSNEVQNESSHEAEALNKLEESFKKLPISDSSSMVNEQQAATSNQEDNLQEQPQVLASEDNRIEENMEIEETVEMEIVEKTATPASSDDTQRAESSSQAKSDIVVEDSEVRLDDSVTETSQETPSQSYDQLDVAEVPSQSAKSENSREPSQSVQYETIDTDDSTLLGEPPTQSFEDAKHAEASQSIYKAMSELNANAPTQSFNEIMQCQENRSSADDESIDDPSFPTQSYEVEKMESLAESLDTDPELSQEGNIPSQSNDIGTDGIGTSSLSMNNSAMNEDETASSSYVPETPETQERDQDQESAISTSSYEIPPCEELNIASSSVIPDTSVREEHSSIHDNGVPEIPTSSYNLNPDSSSTHVDSVPTSSYEDQVIVEQNVSTSYEVSISMPGLEDTSSQNLVTESSDHRNEPSSYYTHHQEVTASYYESTHNESNSRLETSGDTQEEVTASYYDSNTRNEASQSYLAPEEATPSYSAQNLSPSYYEPRAETEASQSYYSTSDLERSERSTLQNVEASQSFYQEGSRQRDGEATPTYTDRYPSNYTSAVSTIDRHDLVESSVPATTRHMER